MEKQKIPAKVTFKPKNQETLRDLIDELYEDSLIASYGHDYAAEQWNQKYLIFGIVTTSLSAIVSASIFSSYESLALVAGLLSLTLVVFSSIATFLNSEQKANSHTKAKFAYREIGDKARILKKMDLPLARIPSEEICEECNKLVERLNATTKESPRLPAKFWHLGQKEYEEDLKEEEAAKIKKRQKENEAVGAKYRKD